MITVIIKHVSCLLTPAKASNGKEAASFVGAPNLNQQHVAPMSMTSLGSKAARDPRCKAFDPFSNNNHENGQVSAVPREKLECPCRLL